MSESFLKLHLRLVILEYGRKNVLSALASLSNQTLEEFEKQLYEVKEKKALRRPKPSFIEILDAKCKELPEIAEPLRKLGLAFQNRTFLPRLQDVQRFLDQLRSGQPKLKSRAASGPILVKMLASLPKEELLMLLAEGNPTDTDFSILARAIMGSTEGEVNDRSAEDEQPAKE